MDYVSWIKDGLEKTGKSQAALARHLGLSRSRITEILKGRRRVQLDEVKKIETFLNLPAPTGITPAPQPKGVRFMGLIDAHQWQEGRNIQPESQSFIAAHLDERYPPELQVHFRVGSQSKSKRITDGDYVIAVPFDRFRSAPIAKDLVIYKRCRGQLRQYVIREARPTPSGHVEMTPIFDWDTNNERKELEPLYLAIAVTRPVT